MASSSGKDPDQTNVVGLNSRRLPDWIDAFLEFTEGINAPEIFRLWSGITAVAGALERRVWVETGQGKIYPNLYVLLLAPPGVGKTEAIRRSTDYWLRVRDLKVAPDSVTKAALIDALADATRKIVLSPTEIAEFNSLQISAPEFGVLLASHDLEFLNNLNHLYDNPPFYRERRRHAKGDPIEIFRPQLNIIAGTQPAYLASLLPEEAWGMGFMSRIIMIYAYDAVEVPLFDEKPSLLPLDKDLLNDMKSMIRCFGRFDWTEETQTAIQLWVKQKMPPRPEHSKLEYYSTRRPVHVLKLMQIASASRSNEKIIRLQDFQRAKGWILHAEHAMPDIFKDMIYKSDSQVIQELHFFAWRIWAKDKKDIHENRLVQFLTTKVPSEKIDKILDIADRSNVVVKLAGTKMYRPRPKAQFGDS